MLMLDQIGVETTAINPFLLIWDTQKIPVSPYIITKILRDL